MTYTGALTGNLPTLGSVPAGYAYSLNTNTVGQVNLVVTLPAPSNESTNVVLQVSGGQMRLSWPQDHVGWRLQSQTNSLVTGIGTNWSDVAGSSFTNQIYLPIDPANGSVFLRLAHP
jgi:hypothetical protein